jgi:hypothetical protein
MPWPKSSPSVTVILAKQFQAGVQRHGEIRPLGADHAGVGLAQEQTDGAIIGRERALGESPAREEDEPDAIAAEGLDEFADLALGPRQPVGLDVLGHHAAADVECDDQVDASLFDLHLAGAPLRPAEGEDHAAQGKQPGGGPKAATPGRGRWRQFAQPVGLRETREAPRSRPTRGPEREPDEGQQPEQPEHFRDGESHDGSTR